MCVCHENVRCPCYRTAREYREEQTRQARASRIEHAVLAVLQDDPDAVTAADPHAFDLAELIRSHPAVHDGATVADVLATTHGIYFWLADGDGIDGMQHYAPLVRPAAVIRLAA
jgi:hypothetical protein